MKHYLLLVSDPATGGPVVGAKEVPACFQPTHAFLRAARESNFGVGIVSEAELPEGGLEGLLLAQGNDLFEIIKRYAVDPSLN